MGCDWKRFLNSNIWDLFWANHVQMRQCHRKVVGVRRIAGPIRSLVNARV